MTEETGRQNVLRVVLFEADGAWMPMCLERHIGTQGATKEEAIEALKVVYRAELDESLRRTGEAFGGIGKAPDKYWDMHKSGDASILRGRIFDDGLGAGMGERTELAETIELAA